MLLARAEDTKSATEVVKLISPEAPADSTLDQFGYSVAIDGDRAIIGARGFDALGPVFNVGRAYIYERSGGVWNHTATLDAPAPAADDWFGASVAIDGDTVVVGARLQDGAASQGGAAFVYAFDGSSWNLEGTLLASDAEANDALGFSVAIDADVIAVGAVGDFSAEFGGANQSKAYVFERSAGVWTETAALHDIVLPVFTDLFGISVGVSGDTVVVGSPLATVGGTSGAGKAYVFVKQLGAWVLQEELTHDSPDISDAFGRSVAIDGDTIAVGAISDDDDGANAGAAFVFTRSGTDWTQEAKLIPNLGPTLGTGDSFGNAISVDGNSIVAGAYLDDEIATNAGTATVFDRSGTTWHERALLIPSDAAASDLFGWSVAVSGTTALVGGDAAATGEGGVYIYDIAVPSGPLSLVVDTTADLGDQNPGDGICLTAASNCSLRAAIQEANSIPGHDTISFAIAGAGTLTITYATPMLRITDQVTIDGTTQSGVACGAPPGFTGRTMRIVLTAGATTGASGLTLSGPSSSNSIIRGLVINDFDDGSNAGILITNGSSGNSITCNLIGTNVTGTTGGGAIGNVHGIRIVDSSNNTVGGLNPGDGNLISGNTAGVGLLIEGLFSSGNVVQGNLFGLTMSGLANFGSGTAIQLTTGAKNNTIGGNTPAARNYLSGWNAATGGILIDAPGTSDNTVAGNYIGLSVAGTHLGNLNGPGVRIEGGAQSNTIGGATSVPDCTDDCNIIVGFTSIGGTGAAAVLISGLATELNVVSGNWIGITAAGTAVANVGEGVRIQTNAEFNVIGGDTPGERNVISGADFANVIISGAQTNRIRGNFIGTTPDGTAAITVAGSTGIILTGAGTTSNQIGGPANTAGVCDGQCNVISGSPTEGIDLRVGANSTVIEGNFIGLNADGTAAIPNNVGILVGSASNAIVRNVISGNTTNGIQFTTTGSNAVQGNLIGTNPTGGSGVGNNIGIRFPSAQTLNTVGGTFPEQANVIAYNISHGVEIVAGSPSISGNSIHSNGGTAILSPVLTRPVLDAAPEAGEQVTGTATGAAGTTFRIELFSSTTCGSPQGETFLGFTTTTGGSAFAITPSIPTVSGLFLTATATATSPAGATTNFSECVQVQAPAGPQIYTVGNTDDSGAGSLRQAIIDANNHAGPDSIHFAFSGIGPHIITPLTPLPEIVSPVTIDGYTQPGATVNSAAPALGTNAVLAVAVDGQAIAGPDAHGFVFGPGSEGSVLRGLSISGFAGSQVVVDAPASVLGNFIGTDAAGTAAGVTTSGHNAAGILVTADGSIVGTDAPADRNLISGHTGYGVRVNAPGLVTVTNNLLGTTATGTAALPNLGPATVEAAGPVNLKNNVIAAGADGVRIESTASGSTVQGNSIGIGADGLTLLGGGSGVVVEGAGNFLVADNVIGDQTDSGILLNGASNVTIVRNVIGATATGAPAGNGKSGIRIFDSSGVKVGGPPADGNLISYNSNNGVLVLGVSSADIRGNQIHSNDGLGIDLGGPLQGPADNGDGVTPNDGDDADTGPNGLQNFPLFVAPAAGNTVALSLAGTPGAPIVIEVFANPVCSPSGHGEGLELIGTAAGVTDGLTGILDVTIPTSRLITSGEILTATATDTGAGETSEFSPCAIVGSASASGVSVDDVRTTTPVLPPGAYFVPLRNIPSAAVAGLANSITAAPVRTIGTLQSSPITSIPIASIPIASIELAGIPITSIPMTSIPITSIGGWEALLEGTDFERQPLQTVTLGEVLPHLPPDTTLADVNIFAAPELRKVSIGSVAAGSLPCSSFPGVCSGQTYFASELTGNAINPTALASLPIASIFVDGTPIASIPIASIPIASIPITSIPIASIPITSIPIASIDPAIASVDTASVNGLCAVLSGLGSDCSVLPTLGALFNSPLYAANKSSFSSIPITSIPIASIPIASIDLGSTPIASIGYQRDVETVPITSIPIASIPIASIPLFSTPIASIPIASIPIASISLSDAIGSAPIASIPIASIPITSIPITSIEMVGTPITSIPIASIPIASIPAPGAAPYTSWCGSATDGGFVELASGSATTCAQLGVTEQSSLVSLYLALDRQGQSHLLDAIRLYDVLQSPLITPAMLEQTSLGAIDFDSLPIASIPIASIPITSIALDGTPITSIEVGGTPITSIPITSIPIASIPAAVPITSIVECTNPTVFDCATQTLLDAAVANAWVPGATLDQLVLALGYELDDLEFTLSFVYGENGTLGRNLGDIDPGLLRLGDLPRSAFAGTTLADLVVAAAGYDGFTVDSIRYFLSFFLGDQSIGDVYARGGDLGGLTIGDILVAIVEQSDYPWEELELDEIGIQVANENAGLPSPRAHYEVDFTVLDGTTGFITTIDVALPKGYVFAGNATLTGGTLSAPVVVTDADFRQTVTWSVFGLANGTQYTLSFDAFTALSLGTRSITATVTVGDQEDTLAGGAVRIVEQGEDTNNAATTAAPLVASSQLLVSHISSADDTDIFQVQAGPPGTRIAIFLGHLGTDADIVMYRAAPPDIISTGLTERTIPLQSTPIGDDGAGTFLPGQDLNPIPGAELRLESLPIVASSSARGARDETIEATSLTPNEVFYVKVTGYNGIFSDDPYVLRVKIVSPDDDPVCEPRFFPFGPPAPLPLRTVPAGGATGRTIVLVNYKRTAQLYGQARADDMMAHLDAFETAGYASIVPVDSAIATSESPWDHNPCDPHATNEVVKDITSVVRQWQQANPLLNVVITGGDDIIPFARVRDLTRLSNERDYASTLADVRGSVYGAAATGHIMTDDPYVDLDPVRWLDRYLYVPDMALGRLVESPEEIGAQLDRFVAANGILDPQSAFTAGYDFLDDGTEAIRATLASYFGPANVQSAAPGWNAAALRTGFFESPESIANINAHYDHYRLLPDTANDPANLFTTGDASLAPGAPTLSLRLMFSMGCHSGLATSDVTFGTSLDPRARDWPQAMAQQGAAVWIGNTGFGYGDRGTIALSERLMGIFATNLDGTMTAGQALMAAKQSYFGTLGLYGVYDEKALQEVTLYGLPMWRLGTGTPVAPPQLPPPAPDPVIGGPVESRPVSVDPDPVLQTRPDGEFYEASGASTYESGSLTENAEAGNQATHYNPLVPRLSFDVTQPDQKAHGAVITALEMLPDRTGIDPLFHRPLVDSSQSEPEFTFDHGAFPDILQTISTYTALDRVVTGGESGPESLRQNLVLMPGQVLVNDAVAVSRAFTHMDVTVYYAPNSDADFVPPVISRIDTTIIDTDGDAGGEAVVAFNVYVTDRQESPAIGVPGAPGEVKRVYILYRPADPSALVWSGIDLVQDPANPARWMAIAELPAGTTAVEIYGQAVDASGNVGINSNKSTNFLAVEDEPAPSPITVTVNDGTLIDGFYDGPVTLEFTVEPPIEGVTFECSLNGSAFGPCPETIEDDGVHRIIVSSSDGTTTTLWIPIATAEQPLLCVAGTYSSSGSEPCTQAPPGSYVDHDGATEATLCAAGTYQPAAGSTSCLQAQPGSYVPTTGAIAPTYCDLGAYQDGFSATSCIPAPIGTYVGTTGATAPTQCPAGTTTAQTGSTSSSDCIPGNADSDGDGVPDTQDNCPHHAGPAASGGCPNLCAEPAPAGYNVITGTNGNNTIIGTPGNDYIVALGGNDTINGNGGDDIICAGDGNDRITTGEGHDFIDAGNGNDDIDAGGGHNVIFAGSGNDKITTGDGDDYVSAGSGNDKVEAGGGHNTIDGGDGNDKLTTGAGNDTIHDLDGNNDIDAGDGTNTVTTGGGNDQITTGDGDDHIASGSGNDNIRAGGGTNTIDAGPGNDQIWGGPGNDTIDGGPGNDTCRRGGGTDTITNCENIHP